MKTDEEEMILHTHLKTPSVHTEGQQNHYFKIQRWDPEVLKPNSDQGQLSQSPTCTVNKHNFVQGMWTPLLLQLYI